MQIVMRRCLLLLSTFTPAGNANKTAGITSLKPNAPTESVLPVSSYNFQPKRTGVIRRPAIKKNRETTNQVNSVLIIDFDLVTLLVSDCWFLNEVL